MSSVTTPGPDDLTLPLHTEDISVTRRRVAGDTVRISTVTRQIDRQVDEALIHERVEIDRVRIGREVDQIPPVREEGDATIMPVVEETVVVQRRLILKEEEVRIRRMRVMESHRETVVVREQDAVIIRTKPGSQVNEEQLPVSRD